ncbi:hypothetical protein J2S40_000843 [Nocardioides luteus]|uniref:DUF6576 domain-containing protein n=1 Tax=Nocardioides luteus TaxID=1844 RepID=A0ABQ5SWL8_9ACTN|nr:DUF6576 domain-containing protein [Nocardioides luteus]MDR7309785.1 hypothetical protein [Nocardioides luteus]GGR61427.1 hypothetical protein GCM10010197_30690 [Nocardioides luteus]GLJ67306.1 hypothetical protein GCM10017579_13420 [Nocardioides luteus]
MRERFRLTPGGRYPHEPWFHIGSLGVTTTWLVVFGSIVGLVLFAMLGGEGVYNGLALAQSNLAALKLWTLVTWPFSYPQFSIFDVLAIFFFWYFGSDLERNELGKVRFAWLLVAFTAVLSVLAVFFGSVLDPTYLLAGLGMLEMMVVLLWIAQWPDRMFIFNIPAWLFGVILVGIQLIQYLGYRSFVMLLVFVVGLAVNAFVARQFGLLDRFAWIPRVAGDGQPKPAKPAKNKKRRSGPTVVAGPWESSTPTGPSKDEQRMDELLDKIHAEGADSLTSKERKELMQLRERRRRG